MLYTTNPQFPVIYSDMQYLSAYPGSNITVRLQVSSSLPLNYQWQHYGTNLVGATYSTLTLTNIAPEDEGLYSVAVSNRLGIAQADVAQLSVISSPVIYSSPGSRSVYPGSSVTFVGYSDGAPPLFYQWYYNGQEIGDATNVALVLTNLQLLQEGYYSFSVSNHYGIALSDSAFLSVVGQAVILTPPAARTVNAGANTSFFVTADGAPPLRYQWQFEGTNITSATNRTLNLTNVQPERAGIYTVVVSNLYGLTSASAL